MDKQEENGGNLQPEIDESEYKPPTSKNAPVLKNQRDIHKIISGLFLLGVIASIVFYLYYGMTNTPQVPIEIPDEQPVVEANDSGPSPEVVARMEAMQRESEAPSPEVVARMESMQTQTEAETANEDYVAPSPDQETLERMRKMNGGGELPNF